MILFIGRKIIVLLFLFIVVGNVNGQRIKDLNPLVPSRTKGLVSLHDGGHSIHLSKQKVLWLFGDSIIGPSKKKSEILLLKTKTGNDQIGRCNTGLLCQGIPRYTKQGNLNSYYPLKLEVDSNRKFASQLLPYLNEESFDAGDRIWPMGGIAVNKKIYIFTLKVNSKTGKSENRIYVSKNESQLDFLPLKCDNGDIFRLPFQRSSASSVGFSSLEIGRSPWISDGFLYCFGSFKLIRRQFANTKSERVIELCWGTNLVRVPLNKIGDANAWDVSYGNGIWGKDRRNARSYFPLNGHCVSIHRNKYLNKWVCVYAPLALPGINDSLEILICFADKPDGHWSEPQLLVRVPEAEEMLDPLFKHEKSSVYVVEIHPWASTDEGRTNFLTFNDHKRGVVFGGWVDFELFKSTAKK